MRESFSWFTPEVRYRKGVWVLFFACILTAMGLFNLYSATSTMGVPYFWMQVRHQTVAVAVVGVSMVLLSTVWDLAQHLKRFSYVYVGGIAVLLVLVLWVGDRSGGAQRWLSLGFMRLQPSEIAKIAMALLGAKFLYERKHLAFHTMKTLTPLLTAAAGLFLLIFMQPDLGTAGLALLVILTQLFFVKIHGRSLIYAGISGSVLALGCWFFVLRDYQKQRILSLIYPESDPFGGSYNQLQSLVAIGSGGAEGKGFLQGTQSHLRFLPSRHTDFIFSVFSEEHGFWWGVMALMLFGALIYLSLEIARSCQDRYLSLLAIGLSAYLFFGFMVNVAMVLGLFPVVGVPLPFFSYGGSSALCVTVVIGLLMSIDGYRVGSHKL